MNLSGPPSVLEPFDRFSRNFVPFLHCRRLPRLRILFRTINSNDKARLRTVLVDATVALRDVEGPDNEI